MQPDYGALTEAVRRLVDVAIRTEVDASSIADATRQIHGIADRLSEALLPGSFALRDADDGQDPAAGNAASGIRNAIAPPVTPQRDAAGAVSAEFDLGAAYEGPPGLVHGGVSALVLDHLLGMAAHRPGRPVFTGTLTIKYLRGTPLGPLRAEADIDRVEGVKTFVTGHIADAEGPTVSAEGIFIQRVRDV